MSRVLLLLLCHVEKRTSLSQLVQLGCTFMKNDAPIARNRIVPSIQYQQTISAIVFATLRLVHYGAFLQHFIYLLISERNGLRWYMEA